MSAILDELRRLSPGERPAFVALAFLGLPFLLVALALAAVSWTADELSRVVLDAYGTIAAAITQSPAERTPRYGRFRM